ncbi:DUF4411 family protein [Legionella sp. km535]|uniref:PIN domain-containing protein n=1 Tax=Legionella sp. km535 TaxID=2498107 RepID=UPI000F8D0D8B|nr:PIN domain-containing protein [Legionella sp. km535]RUR14915.1 DUF4411 family protein [Legionella sp. km535]
MYIFDTSTFSLLFKYYPSRFPSLWAKFDELIKNQKVASVIEVFKELQGLDKNAAAITWTNDNKDIFHKPSGVEANFMMELFKEKNGHFQGMIEKTKQLTGGLCADPFLVAKAKINNLTIITEERYKPNSTKIPAICEYYSIPCNNLEQFMVKENWVF